MAEADERSEKEKMLAGALYRGSPEIVADQRRCQSLLHQYNATRPDATVQRAALLRDLLGGIGKGTVIRPPFHCDFGYNIRLGGGVFLNFGCVLLDVVPIEIGDLCQIGSLVQILTADHPRDPALRRQGYESGIPISIGENVWIGSGAIILPGVTIGDDAIIGAGSIVTRNVPAGATVMGNPARVIARSE
jgi:maltose O-acetyltransferase